MGRPDEFLRRSFDLFSLILIRSVLRMYDARDVYMFIHPTDLKSPPPLLSSLTAHKSQSFDLHGSLA